MKKENEKGVEIFFILVIRLTYLKKQENREEYNFDKNIKGGTAK